MASVRFNTAFAMHQEEGVSPPMQRAVTIPVKAEHNGKRIEGVVLYVGVGAFVPRVSAEVFQSIVDAVVEQLMAREG